MGSGVSLILLPVLGARWVALISLDMRAFALSDCISLCLLQFPSLG